MFKLRYQTGTATFIQLAIAVFVVVINNFIILIDSCNSAAECAAAAMFSLFFIIATAAWFGFLSMIGYKAEEQRNHRAAYVLIASELATAAVVYGFFANPGGTFGKLSALLILLTCGWVIMLAWRLARARGKRIVAHHRKTKS